MTSPAALPVLETERLVVRFASEPDVPAVVRYWAENREFLKPFEPARPDSFFEEHFWGVQVRQSIAEYRVGRAARFFLFSRESPGEVLGNANLTRIQRGVSHSCSLGYGLSEHQQGKGLMRETLEALLPWTFQRLGLHRVEASYMPHNRRSGNLLRALGFVVEGYARDYLQIDGRWEDHILTSLTHPDWQG